MSDRVLLGKDLDVYAGGETDIYAAETGAPDMPALSELQAGLEQSSRLVDDIILKKYLHNLTDLEIIPLDDSLKQISDIRLFKITEMVYQKDEYSTYKFASVFSSVQNLNCGIFIIADSDGEKTDFYMGVRALDNKRTTKSLKDTLKNALTGQFPGVKTDDLLDPQAEAFLNDMPSRNIAAVSCVANNKDDDFKDNETFIQGLEKLALAMQGQKYTAVVLAKSTPPEQLDELRRSYETIYTQLSPYANMQLSYGQNEALSISDALSHGTTTGTSYTKNTGTSKGTSHARSVTETESTTKPSALGTFAKTAGSAALGLVGLALAPLTGGVSVAASAALTVGQMAINSYTPPTKTKGTSTSDSYSENEMRSEGEAYGTNESTNDSQTRTKGLTSGKSENMQLTMQNKTLLDTLDRIDLQLKRLDECESLGMWECGAYFLADSQETAEMAAGTYKALMKGTKSGVETSAINFWGRMDKKKLPLLRDYITSFIHPVFAYQTNDGVLPVSAATLVSSNELAIQMGLPRKSVCGFPVIEHADFGKEVVAYSKAAPRRQMCIGKIFSMGTAAKTDVKLDIDSLTMHTFVTGSTGSGKSNTVYEILNQLHELFGVPFLVIEPAKGEYKNVFAQYTDVTVYGTNPKKTQLLRINPFSFPEDVHILEHLDRLVEIFNVCWPMYAAMPAILKDAIERAYVAAGWDLTLSENKNGNKFPNFTDVLNQIEAVINESKYSADSKGDYSGALLTRVRSLTTGLNGLIFTNDEVSSAELFDKSVIVDLSRVGSTETKSLIMGLLIMKLNEYRMSYAKANAALSHITVLEEAHNLLKRTSTEQSSESSNLLGKSVELLANSIAEMRTYGEGFIIADQSPGLLDMSVIRNTNTKIVLRLPDRGDRELVGYAAGLDDEQIDELSKLRRGVAAIYQNDWVEPVLVQVNKCGIEEIPYTYSGAAGVGENIHEQLVNLLIQGRMQEKLEFSAREIEAGMDTLALSSENIEFVKQVLGEYNSTHKLTLWEQGNFCELAKKVTDILGVRTQVDSCLMNAVNTADLVHKLRQVILSVLPGSSRGKIAVLSQCMMRDATLCPEDTELRKMQYNEVCAYIKKRGAKR